MASAMASDLVDENGEVPKMVWCDFSIWTYFCCFSSGKSVSYGPLYSPFVAHRCRPRSQSYMLVAQAGPAAPRSGHVQGFLVPMVEEVVVVVLVVGVRCYKV